MTKASKLQEQKLQAQLKQLQELEIIEPEVTVDFLGANKPVINAFYESINIPYCKECGEKQIKSPAGDLICLKNKTNCIFT